MKRVFDLLFSFPEIIIIWSQIQRKCFHFFLNLGSKWGIPPISAKKDKITIFGIGQ